jgi:serine/threonine-protein kinase RsbW
MASAHQGGPEANPPGKADSLHRQAAPASARCLPVLRDELVEWARAVGLHASVTESLALAAYEAMANAVEHAYDGSSGPLDVEAVRLADRVQVTVTDHGNWVPAHQGDQQRKRGLPLIRRLADDTAVTAARTGTTVRMSWLHPAGEAEEATKAGGAGTAD